MLPRSEAPIPWSRSCCVPSLRASTEHLMDRFEQLAELVGGELLRARLRQQSSLTEYQEGVEAHIEELSSRIARLEVLREN
jgi:hypothetical protein